MFLFICRYCLGYLRIEFQGASPERLMNMCVHHDITIWNLKKREELYSCYITLKGFKALRPILRKTKCRIKVLEKCGLPFVLYKYRNRKLFAIGAFLFILTIFNMSRYVWYIDLSGNQMYTTEDIIEFLNSQGIQRTAPSDDIDCDEVVSLLRKEYDNIIWASAHMDGSVIVIEVKENQNIIEIEEEIELTVSDSDPVQVGYDIIAQCDGTVSYMVTSKGTPLVTVGDTVETGQILVSGRIDITDDYDVILGYNYVTAEADIVMETSYEYFDEASMTYYKKEYSEDEYTDYFLHINDYYIDSTGVSIFLFGIKTEESLETDIYEKTYDISPIQQNLLNISVGYSNTKFYSWSEYQYTQEAIQNVLSSNFATYCKELEEKKVEIIENNVKIHIGEDVAYAIGDVEVAVTNTKTQQTEILEEPIIMTEEGITE